MGQNHSLWTKEGFLLEFEERAKILDILMRYFFLAVRENHCTQTCCGNPAGLHGINGGIIVLTFFGFFTISVFILVFCNKQNQAFNEILQLIVNTADPSMLFEPILRSSRITGEILKTADASVQFFKRNCSPKKYSFRWGNFPAGTSAQSLSQAGSDESLRVRLCPPILTSLYRSLYLP